MRSELERRPMLGGNEGGSSFGDELKKEISLLQREQRQQDSANDHKKERNLYRSGSAPPTVEGSLSAVGGLFNHGGAATFLGFPNSKSGNGFLSEEELRSDPSYSSYYYSNVNLNPRLPPPLVSKEGWWSTQMLQRGSSVLGGIGDRRKVNRNDSGGDGGRSPFSMPPGFRSKKGESESDSGKTHGLAEWGVDGLIGLPGLGLGGKQKSIAEILQDDLGHTSPAPGHPSRSASRNVFEHAEPISSVKPELPHLRNELLSANIKRSNGNVQSPFAVQNGSIPPSYSYAAALGSSLSRSTTPDPQPVPRVPSPCLIPGRDNVNTSEKRCVTSPNLFNGISTTLTETADLATALSCINLSNDVIGEESHFPPQFKPVFDDHGNYPFNMQSGQNNSKHHSYMEKFDSGLNNSSLVFDRQVGLRSAECPTNSYHNGSTVSALDSNGSLPSHYQHLDSHNSSFLNYGLSGYSRSTGIPSMMGGHLGTSNLSHLYENVAATSAMCVGGMDPRVLASGFCVTPGASESHNQAPLVDPMYLQYLRTAEYAAARSDPSLDINYIRNSFPDILHKAYMGSLLSPHKSQYVGTTGTKTGGSNHHGPAYGLGFSYPGNPMASLAGPGSPSVMKNSCGSMMGPSWNLQTGYNSEDFTSSLLEDFKSNKAKCFELSEITGHVVDFSVDQYGSRFIQQKLETATIEEKNIVFEEINPEALTLMTDVFGNYVIQKFFEHGLVSQKRELASKLFGHVLMLSLQMYGCRVIQKAIEVVDMDQKIKMVEELDGNVMRCVRDQNGNHVIQKCIECIPEEHIQFIISTFYDQVAILSAHPYGCRVIQRILEHCRDLKTQIKVMDEVLGSVSMLAQDQYGNYVIQHVLEHGKPLERSTIIKELAGKIVQMSQQKFASNVVEKCLTFGGPSERQLLVDEMLGSTDENEPLQAMMKDQFANYVVQKVLETCDDQHRELILSRIKVHLNALKKYTYGKHIVARVEKLVAAGERRIAIQSTHLA